MPPIGAHPRHVASARRRPSLVAKKPRARPQFAHGRHGVRTWIDDPRRVHSPETAREGSVSPVLVLLISSRSVHANAERLPVMISTGTRYLLPSTLILLCNLVVVTYARSWGKS